MLLLRDEPQLARMLGDAVRHQRSAGRSADPPPADVGRAGRGAGRARAHARRAAGAPRRGAAERGGRRRQRDDEEARLRAIRRFQAEETLRIGLHDVAGDLEPARGHGQLTDLAEACLQQGIAAALPALARSATACRAPA